MEDRVHQRIDSRLVHTFTFLEVRRVVRFEARFTETESAERGSMANMAAATIVNGALIAVAQRRFIATARTIRFTSICKAQMTNE